MSNPPSTAPTSRTSSMRDVGSGFTPLAAAGGAAGAAALAAARSGGRSVPGRDFGLGFVPDTESTHDDASETAPPPYAPRQSSELLTGATEPRDLTSHARGPSLSAPLVVPAHGQQQDSNPFSDNNRNPFEDGDDQSLLSGDTFTNALAFERAVDTSSIVSSLRDDESGSIYEATVTNVSRGPSTSSGVVRRAAS